MLTSSWLLGKNTSRRVTASSRRPPPLLRRSIISTSAPCAWSSSRNFKNSVYKWPVNELTRRIPIFSSSRNSLSTTGTVIFSRTTSISRSPSAPSRRIVRSMGVPAGPLDILNSLESAHTIELCLTSHNNNITWLYACRKGGRSSYQSFDQDPKLMVVYICAYSFEIPGYCFSKALCYLRWKKLSMWVAKSAHHTQL